LVLLQGPAVSEKGGALLNGLNESIFYH